MASEKGHVDAMYKLARFYDTGMGVPADKEKAVKWFSKASQPSIPGALTNAFSATKSDSSCAQQAFIPTASFTGPQPGFTFRNGPHGTGFYIDQPAAEVSDFLSPAAPSSSLSFNSSSVLDQLSENPNGGIPQPPSSAFSSPSSISNYKKRVEEIYRSYNPSKLSEIPKLLEKYAGREEELIVKLEEKYIVPTTTTTTFSGIGDRQQQQPPSKVFFFGGENSGANNSNNSFGFGQTFSFSHGSLVSGQISSNRFLGGNNNPNSSGADSNNSSLPAFGSTTSFSFGGRQTQSSGTGFYKKP
jgi:hypothetical protein